MSLRWRTDCLPFNSQDLVSNSPYCLPYSSCDVSLENLALDQLIIPSLVFFVILITCLLDIVLILEGEILSWSPTGVKGLNTADYLGRTFVGMPAKFVPDILQNSSVIITATFRGWKQIIFCIILPMNSLQVYFDLRYNCSCLRWVSLLFLCQIIFHVM